MSCANLTNNQCTFLETAPANVNNTTGELPRTRQKIHKIFQAFYYALETTNGRVTRGAA